VEKKLNLYITSVEETRDEECYHYNDVLEIVSKVISGGKKINQKVMNLQF